VENDVAIAGYDRDVVGDRCNGLVRQEALPDSLYDSHVALAAALSPR